MSKKKSNATVLGCLLLFALPFAGVGVFMGYRTISSLFEWSKMRSWIQVETQIESVELDVNRGDDSNSYEAKAHYRYTYQGSEYRGFRVSLHPGSDSVGSFQKDVYAELSRSRGQGFPGFVNPREPTESVLYRELRWEMLAFNLLFVVLFGGAGFGIMAAGLYGSKKIKRDEALQALHSNEPWLQKEEWQTGRIRSSSKAAFLFSLVFAVFWNLVSSPTLFFIYEAIQGKREPVVFIAVLFPLVGAGLAFWAVKNWIRYRTFGESVFEMHYMPGVIGGPFAGLLRTKAGRNTNRFDATLSSIRKRRSGRGKNSSTSERALWQKTGSFAYDRARDGVLVSFQIPFECSPTDEEDSNNRTFWRLSIDAETEGVDYHVQFEVPVFRTEHSSEVPLEEASVDVTSRIEVPLEDKLRACGARVERLASGKRFVFPMARYLVNALGLSVFFLLWTGVVVALAYSDAPAIFPWLFGFFDLLIFLGVLDFWFHGSRIEASHGRLGFASGLFGGGRLRSLAASDVENVKPKRGTQSGNKLYYQLELRERGGKRHTLAKRLPDLDTAERLASEIHALLGSG